MKVALVHDDLVQWGGAERVLIGISEMFPDAPIYTSVFDESNPILKEKFKGKKIVTSFIKKIPGWRGLYRGLLPLYPIAFEQFDFSDFDLVISQTTKFAKAIITKPQTTHICYLHTPPRFLWKYSGESVFSALNPYLSHLRFFDQISSKRVDFFLAGSVNCQQRIKSVYKVDSLLLQPFVDLERFEGLESFDGGYFLIIARLNSYKRVDLAVDAFGKIKDRLKIVGVGPELGKLKLKVEENKDKFQNIEFLGSVSESVLVNLIAGSRGLIVTAEEDFGLTPLEAQALGKAVIAYRSGGVVETVVENKTGVFFDEQSVESMLSVLDTFKKTSFLKEDCINNAKRFSKSHFQAKLRGYIEQLV